MKKIVIIYGLVASVIISGVSSVLLWSVADSTHAHSAWLGYLIMVIGLSMVFVGIKQHRDKNLGGVIRFGTAFQVGILITLIACFFYVAVWEVYMYSSDGSFMQNYQDSYLQNLKETGASAEELQNTAEEMNYFAEQYKNPFFRMFITLLEILPVGLIVTLLSATLLRTRKKE